MTTPDLAPTAALEPKTKLSGKILKTTLAGALVDVGQNIPGVLHISQLSKDSVNKVEDVVKEGHRRRADTHHNGHRPEFKFRDRRALFHPGTCH